MMINQQNIVVSLWFLRTVMTLDDVKQQLMLQSKFCISVTGGYLNAIFMDIYRALLRTLLCLYKFASC